MCLNELHDDMLHTLPPTDSRLRPDVRILEEGNIGKIVLTLAAITENLSLGFTNNADIYRAVKTQK